MNKPCLIIMAAGLGSRYGGLKQIDPVDADGCAIIHYSIFDALRAGFDQIVLIVKPEHERDFNEVVGARIGGRADIRYAHQLLGDVPDGIAIPEGRTKPWGTAHAVLSARKLVDGPFCVINADDFYGQNAYRQIFDFLTAQTDPRAHAMVGYRLKNTQTDNGFVSRGVCQADADGRLTSIVERIRIEHMPSGGVGYTEDGGLTHTPLDPDTLVSMNMWGFGSSMMDEIERRFKPFLQDNLPKDPLKCEYYLPYVPDCLIRERAATVAVLPTDDHWYGITYQDDMPSVRAAIASMKRDGLYPERLWG